MKKIDEISSYEVFNDLFRINFRTICDSDNEYTKDFEIDYICWINWHLILETNGIDPDIDLAILIEDLVKYQQIFELEINYNKYDCSIRKISVSKYWLKKINDLIEKYHRVEELN